MPLQIESREECAAWIVRHLDDRSRCFVPDTPVMWLELGRENKDTLPWVKELHLLQLSRKLEAEQRRARPHCNVDRKWLRLALNTMAGHLEKMKDAELVRIAFKDGVLSFQLGAERVILSARGDSWRSNYLISAGEFRDHPKRLMSDPVVVGIWDSRLELDRHRYAGVREEDEITDNL